MNLNVNYLDVKYLEPINNFFSKIWSEVQATLKHKNLVNHVVAFENLF